MQKTLTCIGCPMGCQLDIEIKETEKGPEILDIKGYACNRGKTYAYDEITRPVRMITTLIPAPTGGQPLSVRSSKPVPKDQIESVLKIIHNIKLISSVKMGDIIVADILGSGADIIATGDLNIDLPDNLEIYAHRRWDCACGQYHDTEIQRIITGNDSLEKLPSLLSEQKTTEGRLLDPDVDRVLLFADKNTAALDLDHIEELCSDSGFALDKCVLKTDQDLVPDEHAVFSLIAAVEKNTGLIIAHGSGTINDIARFVSYKLKIPYYIVATAPSMDGYTSTVSPLIHNGMKITYEACGAAAVIAKNSLLASSPTVMLAAGLGDILGKYSALADWRLAYITENEYWCPETARLVYNTVQSTLEAAESIANRDSMAVAKVMNGLIMTGIAMSYVGNSRPASGSEHHLSHFWEMRFLQNKKPAVLHGSKVGLATILTCALYRHLLSIKPDFTAARNRLNSLPTDYMAKWQQQMEKSYGDSAAEIIALEERSGKNDPIQALRRIDRLESNWAIIREIAEKSIPDPAVIREALFLNGGAVQPQELNISADLVIEAVLYARELRNRYTILQLYWDLGIIEDAKKIAGEVYNL